MGDFNLQRLAMRKAVNTEFQRSWAYRIEIEEEPADFDLFVKDVSYGPIEITTDALKAGIQALQFPVSAEPVAISMTMRDHADQRIYNWASAWAGKVINPDGTINPPLHPEKGYVRKWSRHQLRELAPSEGSFREESPREWGVFITQMGDISESRSEQGFLEFPVTFIQFRS